MTYRTVSLVSLLGVCLITVVYLGFLLFHRVLKDKVDSLVHHTTRNQLEQDFKAFKQGKPLTQINTDAGQSTRSLLRAVAV